MPLQPVLAGLFLRMAERYTRVRKQGMSGAAGG
jgi:hypothetical protein